MSSSDGRIVFGRKTLSAALVTLMVIAGFSYLTLVNIRAVKGFEIRKLEQKIADLEEVYKRLEQEAAQLQSIQRIEQQLSVSNFIPTTNVSYLTPSDYALSGEEGATP